MKRKLLFLKLMILGLSMQSMAQVIKGRVTASSDNQPLTGVTVLIKGTNAGTTN